MERAKFEQIAVEQNSSAGVAVALEDRRMGLIAHWDDDGVQIEAYRGNDHECLRVPWKNLIDTPIGIIVGLKGVEAQA